MTLIDARSLCAAELRMLGNNLLPVVRREQGPGRRRHAAPRAAIPQEPVEAAGVSQALLGAGRRSPERSAACA